MQDFSTVPVGEILTQSQVEARDAATRLTGKDRYQVVEVTGGWQAWDAEDAEALADLDGTTVFTRWEDAHDLAAEHIG
jgi:hypothetical protein